MRGPIDHGGDLWRTATLATGILFIVQVVLLLSLRGIRERDYGAIPTTAYFIVAAISLTVAGIVRWRWGSNRGLDCATAGTAALWAISAVTISVLSWAAGG